jgi:hypothetical protein
MFGRRRNLTSAEVQDCDAAMTLDGCQLGESAGKSFEANGDLKA